MFIKNRFRFKLTTAFVVSTVVPFLIMGIVALSTINEARLESVKELEIQSLLQTKGRINNFLLSTAEASKLIVGVSDDVSNIGIDNIDFLIRGLSQDLKNVVSIDMISMSGDPVGRKSNYQYLETPNSFDSHLKFLYFKDLQEYKKQLDVLLEQARIDRDNYPDRIEDLQSLKDLEAKYNKIPVYHSDLNKTLKGNIFSVFAPVISNRITIAGRPFGTIIGFTMVTVKVDSLLDNFEKQIIGNNGYFLLVDKYGYIISGGGKWGNGMLTSFNSDHIKGKPDVKDGSVVYFYKTIDPFSQQVMVGETVVDPDLGWKLVAVWPKSDAFATTKTLSLTIILATLLTFLLVLFLTVLLSQQVVKPIELLRQKADLIGKGDLKQEIKIKTDDEIEDLGLSFNKMAEGLQEIQKLKDEFVFIAAHELRTPVTAIKGYLSMMLDGDFGVLGEALKPVVDKVKGVNEQLVRLVNDLLEIARAEAGRTTIIVKEVNLAQVTAGVIDSLGAWAINEKVKLIYEKPKTDLLALADENKLVEILNNFGSNAIKYNRKDGTGTVTFIHEEKNGMIVTKIKDNGIGMTKEELAHLFEKFFRAENEDVRKVTGTGLGLFVVKQLVEKMGGTVNVESERGRGTTFMFSLKKSEQPALLIKN